MFSLVTSKASLQICDYQHVLYASEFEGGQPRILLVLLDFAVYASSLSQRPVGLCALRLQSLSLRPVGLCPLYLQPLSQRPVGLCTRYLVFLLDLLDLSNYGYSLFLKDLLDFAHYTYSLSQRPESFLYEHVPSKT